MFQLKNDSIISHYSTSSGLLSNHINSIALNQNELLVSTVRGLSIINLETDDVKKINEFNYLPSNDVLMCKVINDQFWIGTRENLTVIDRAKIDDFSRNMALSC